MPMRKTSDVYSHKGSDGNLNQLKWTESMAVNMAQVSGNRTNRMYSMWKKYCSSTDAHGFKFMVEDRSSIWRRIIWGICCLAALTFVIIYCEDRISRFLMYDVKSNIHLQIGDMPMPAITICNKNEVSLSKFDADDAALFLWPIFDDTVSETDAIEQMEAIRKQPGVNATINVLTKYKRRKDAALEFFYDEWLQQKGYTYKELVVECYYAGKRCTKYKKVSINTTSLNFPYGQCVTINAKGAENFIATRPGVTISLRVKLDTENFNYLRMRQYFQTYGYNNLSFALPNSRPGIFLQIHHPSTYPEFMTGKKVAIYDGDRVNILIDKMVVVQRMKPPYQNCSDGVDYRRCLKNCAYSYIDNKYTAEHHGTCSVIPYDPPPEYWKNPSNRPFCAARLPESFASILEEAFAFCIAKKKCPHGCEEVSYNYQEQRDSVNFIFEQTQTSPEQLCEQQTGVIYENFGNIWEYGTSGEDVNQTQFEFDSNISDDRECLAFLEERKRQGGALIRVEFQSLVGEEIIYTPDYTFENLLAEVGGMMGLFIGMSLLTLIHILDFMFTHIFCSKHCTSNVDVELGIQNVSHLSKENLYPE